VSNLDRLTLQVEVRELAELTDESREKLSKRIAAATKIAVSVTPRVELHDAFSLPRMTTGQGKTACHRVDDRRGCSSAREVDWSGRRTPRGRRPTPRVRGPPDERIPSHDQ
jgi:hypothetical protein